METRERVLQAALKLFADFDADDLLRTLTLEALRDAADPKDGTPPPAPKTISRAFKGSDGHYSRSVLLDAMLGWALREQLAVASSNADTYRIAAEAVRRGGGVEAVMAVFDADRRDYELGATSPAADIRERLYYLCLAFADEDASLASLLAKTHQAVLDTYRPAYQEFLQVTNRQLRSGVSMDQLHYAVSGQLEGALVYMRHRIDMSSSMLGQNVLLTFWALTTPTGEPELDPVSEMFGTSQPRT